MAILSQAGKFPISSMQGYVTVMAQHNTFIKFFSKSANIHCIFPRDCELFCGWINMMTTKTRKKLIITTSFALSAQVLYNMFLSSFSLLINHARVANSFCVARFSTVDVFSATDFANDHMISSQYYNVRALIVLTLYYTKLFVNFPEGAETRHDEPKLLGQYG